MPPRAYSRDLQFCLCLVVYSPPPGMQKESIPHPRAPDQTYMCVLGVHLFKSKIFQNCCVVFDYSCIIHIKLQPHTKLLRQFHLFSNFCPLLPSPPNRKSKPPPRPLFKVVLAKNQVYIFITILSYPKQFWIRGVRKSGIHLAEVSVFARMIGKNRHFRHLSQQVLSGL